MSSYTLISDCVARYSPISSLLESLVCLAANDTIPDVAPAPPQNSGNNLGLGKGMKDSSVLQNLHAAQPLIVSLDRPAGGPGEIANDEVTDGAVVLVCHIWHEEIV